MASVGPLQLTASWKCAFVSECLAFPFTALEVWQSPERVAPEMFVVGSVLAGSLIEQRGGNSTTTGPEAAVIGGFPVLWILPQALSTVTNVPNPPLFRAVNGLITFAFGGRAVTLVAVLGMLDALDHQFLGEVDVFDGIDRRLAGSAAVAGHDGESCRDESFRLISSRTDIDDAQSFAIYDDARDGTRTGSPLI
jgi:hypothetical protein